VGFERYMRFFQAEKSRKKGIPRKGRACTSHDMSHCLEYSYHLNTLLTGRKRGCRTLKIREVPKMSKTVERIA
jgi:hypothetical protein